MQNWHKFLTIMQNYFFNRKKDTWGQPICISLVRIRISDADNLDPLMFYHFPNRLSHRKITIFGIDRECSGKCLNYIIYNWDLLLNILGSDSVVRLVSSCVAFWARHHHFFTKKDATDLQRSSQSRFELDLQYQTSLKVHLSALKMVASKFFSRDSPRNYLQLILQLLVIFAQTGSKILKTLSTGNDNRMFDFSYVS